MIRLEIYREKVRKGKIKEGSFFNDVREQKREEKSFLPTFPELMRDTDAYIKKKNGELRKKRRSKK